MKINYSTGIIECKNEDELKNYIQAFAKRKFHAPYRKEMNRSVKKMIESWK